MVVVGARVVVVVVGVAVVVAAVVVVVVVGASVVVVVVVGLAVVATQPFGCKHGWVVVDVPRQLGRGWQGGEVVVVVLVAIAGRVVVPLRV